MEKTKYTKRDNYETLKAVLVDDLTIDFETQERLTAFIDHELEQLDKRKVNAKTYAAKKAKEPDALEDGLVAYMSQNPAATSIANLISALPADLDPTQQKLTYRLNKLVDEGLVDRETVSVKEEGKATRRVNFYTWVGETE